MDKQQGLTVQHRELWYILWEAILEKNITKGMTDCSRSVVPEWIAISFSRGSSQPRAQTRVSRIVDRRFTVWAPREVLMRVESSWMGLLSFRNVPRELWPFCHRRHSKKMALDEPGCSFSPSIKSADAVVLDFPASRTVRNKCLLFELPSLCYFCYNSPNSLRTSLKLWLRIWAYPALGKMGIFEEFISSEFQVDWPNLSLRWARYPQNLWLPL